MESYRAINAALAAGLRLLGVHAEEIARAPVTSGPDTNLACFEKAYRHEVYVDGRKIAASAQSRTAGGFLQQGTVPLARSGALFASATTLPFPERAALARRLDDMTATPEDSLRRPVGFEEATDALARGFEEVFKVSLLKGVPTPQEEETARRIMQERYLDWAWTAGRAASLAPDDTRLHAP
jgi:lipoate-protein ligase A